MLLRIMRHGDAPFLGRERELSELGYQEAELMGAWLGQQAPMDLMLVSPLLRAQQTADMVEKGLPYRIKRLEESLLLPETPLDLCGEYLKSLEHQKVIAVSHMPLVANLLAYFDPKRAQYFATAAVADLYFDQQLKLEHFEMLTPQAVKAST